MTKPIKETDSQIVIDKQEVESLTQRFLAAAKAFFLKLIGQNNWDRLGLEKTWRFFLPLIVVVTLCGVYYAAYFLAVVTLIITAIWLWKSSRK